MRVGVEQYSARQAHETFWMRRHSATFMLPSLPRAYLPFRSALRLVIGLFVGLLAACACVALAAEPARPTDPRPLDFAIPSQPLADALHAYQQRVRVQVLYEAASASGRKSTAVVGKFTPDQALKHLLQGTDLEIRYAGPDAVALVGPRILEPDVPPASPLAGVDLSLGELRVRGNAKVNDMERFQDYSESVRAEIQRVLLKNSKTGSGNYRAVIELWIDPARTVQKVALLESTGELSRDAAITQSLQGLTIKPPTPADAPQPIRAVVVVRTAQ